MARRNRMRYLIILCLLLSGCAGWDWDYDPIEDEIIIEKVEVKND